MGNIKPKNLLILFSVIWLSLINPSFSAITRDARAALQYRQQGLEAQRAGSLDMALNYYQRAINADPQFAVAYNDIGVILEAKGQHQKAKEAYLRAVTLDEHLLSGYYNLASLYEQEGDFKQAAYYWRLRMQLGDWSDIWTWKAKDRLEALYASGKLAPETDHERLDQTLALTNDHKRDAQYHLYRARRYIAEGNYVAALKELTKGVVLDPGNAEIERLLDETQQRVLLYKYE